MTATKALRKSRGVIIFIGRTVESPSSRPSHGRAARDSKCFCRTLGFVRRCGSLQGCGCATRIVGTADAVAFRGGDAHCDATDRQDKDTQDVREEVGFPVVSHAFYCSMDDMGSAANIITISFVRPSGLAARAEPVMVGFKPVTVGVDNR
jgi:hypothetical protein